MRRGPRAVLTSAALLACAGLSLPTRLLAQSTAGPYVAITAGGDLADSMHSVHGVTVIDTQAGPAVTGALGWRVGNGLRAELEGAYRQRGIDGVLTRRTTGLLEPLTDVSGHVSTPSVMANLAYDIPVSSSPYAVRPYIGAGAGYGWLDLGARGHGYGIFNLPDNNTYTGPDSVAFGSGGAFAYQAIVGASLPLRGAPGLELTAEYRFFGTANAKVPVLRVSTSGDTINGVIPSFTEDNTFQVHENMLMLGVRYRFGAL